MKIEKRQYPDGTFYPVITEFYPELASPENLTFRINSYQDLWFLKQIKDVLDFNKCKCNLIIPCLLDAQADRRFNSNESHNLKLVCQFINNMEWESVSVFHPHNQEIVEALIDNVNIIDNSDFIDNVLYKIGYETYKVLYNGIEDLKNGLILMGTDAGSFKWLMKLSDELNWQGEVYNASKSRKYVDGNSVLTQVVDREDFNGKDVLLVDDLGIFAGTFVGLGKMLKERNVGKLYLALSHITVPNPNKELETLYDRIFTTNSKGLEYDLNNLEIIKLFPD